MQRRKRCCVCGRLFEVNPRLGNRQKTCGYPACREQLHIKNCSDWRSNNPTYFKNYYQRVVKPWRDTHRHYLRQYRDAHPEYVERNKIAQQKRDYLKKRILPRSPSEISHLDIQDSISLKIPVVIGNTIRLVPFLDIQDSMGNSS